MVGMLTNAPVVDASSSLPSSEFPAEFEAGLILAATVRFAARGLPHPSLADVISKIEERGISLERAFEAQAAILERLHTLLEPSADRQGELTREVRDYLFAHPGAAQRGPQGEHYSRPFRRFVLELRERYDEFELEDFAAATCMPLRTLSIWMRRARRS